MNYAIWQKLYRDAMRENDTDVLTELVSKAEAAMFDRLQELASNPGGEEEKRAIQAACDDLLEIKTARLGWPRLRDKSREGRAIAEPEQSVS
jgi:hypothetical protein